MAFDEENAIHLQKLKEALLNAKKEICNIAEFLLWQGMYHDFYNIDIMLI